MAVSIGQIEAEIIEELQHPELNQSVVRRLLQAANRIILAAEHWEQEPQEVAITLPAEATGTDAGVTLESATVTTGDAVAAWVGRSFRRGTDPFFYEITAQSAGVSITLELAWPLATATAQSFTVFPRLLTPHAAAAEIIEVWGEQRLEKRTLQWLNDHDPKRETTATVPQVWVPATRSSLDVPRIEVWPRPTTATPLRIFYERTGDISGDGILPIYPAHLLTLLGGSTCATRLFSRTNNATWFQVAQAKYQEYKIELQTAILQNRDRVQAQSKVQRADLYGPVTDFALDHDVWWGPR